MAFAGVGVDIVEIARIRRTLERRPSFKERVFTADERAYCDASARPADHYAARFAAREAVLKALGTGFSEGIAYSDVSVAREENGRPYCVLAGRAKEIAEQRGVEEVELSLSFTREVAVANALLITEDVRPKREQRATPEQHLAKSFKEARVVIDELDRLQGQISDTLEGTGTRQDEPGVATGEPGTASEPGAEADESAATAPQQETDITGA